MSVAERTPPEVGITAEVALRGDRLTISFQVHNRSDEGVYVYLHPDDGRRTAVLPGAYVCASSEESELRLLLAPPPPPRHYFVPRGVVPLARLLGPGETYEGRIDLSLPVEEWTAYVPFDPDAEPDDIIVDHGVLRVGFFPASRERWSDPGPESGTLWAEGEELHTVDARFDLPQAIHVVGRLDGSLRW